MRRVSLEYLEPGMVVARSIYNSDGRPLLGEGMVLNDNYIQRLEDYGIGAILVKDGLFDDISGPYDVISERTRIESIVTVKEAFKSFETKKRISMKGINGTVGGLMDELLSNRELLINCTDIRTYDDYTFCHSVQVCVLSIMTGVTMGFDQLKLKELAVGALIHDIGKTRVDRHLINKPGTLTPKEFDQIKSHSEHGFEILRRNKEISLLAAHIAFQHHEHADGKGYPRGIAGEDIHPFARIVAVADVFDALVADRPYRKAYSTNQAMTIMRQGSGTHFDAEALEALLANIAEYPVGSVVSLVTGEIAVVVENRKDKANRPLIKIILDRRMKRLTLPIEVDLSQSNQVQISRILSEEEVVKTFKSILPGISKPQDAS